MNKRIKVSFVIFGLVIISAVAFMAFGFYSMEIEDTYGDNQDIFYNSKQGDLVVNHETKEFGEISKSWTRFYVVKQADTVDIYEWWDDKNIQIYRPADKGILVNKINYEDIDRLVNRKELELIKTLR